MLNYEQAIDFIHSRPKFKKDLTFSNMRTVLERIGNPHKKLKFIHIAGTNGKGSVSSYISNVLSHNGYKTGLFISPFLYDFRERIQVNNSMITQSALADCVNRIIEVSDGVELAEFDFVCAVAFLYFAEQNCDYVVLEVGLGGRFDATNVIGKSEVSVIVQIGLDHTHILGNTISEIAFEKCGIIKQNGSVVAYPDNCDEANNVIRKIAKERDASLYIADKSKIKVISQNIYGSEFLFDGVTYKISMTGTHQVYNAVCAISALKSLGLDLEIAEALSNTKFSGRFEILDTEPLVIADGAHNPPGIESLEKNIKLFLQDKKKIIVMGMVADKQYAECIEKISTLADIFIATGINNPRSLQPKDITEIAEKSCDNVLSFENSKDALKKAKELYSENSAILICGSLYLIGEIGK